MNKWASEHPEQDYDAHFDALREEADRTKHEPKPRGRETYEITAIHGNDGSIYANWFAVDAYDETGAGERIGFWRSRAEAEARVAELERRRDAKATA